MLHRDHNDVNDGKSTDDNNGDLLGRNCSGSTLVLLHYGGVMRAMTVRQRMHRCKVLYR